MKDNLKVVIGGYYGFGNLGDELILSLMIGELQRRGTLKITVLSRNPADTSRVHGVAAVNRWNPIAVLRAMRDTSRFILGGGGLLQDKTSPLSLLYYLGLVQAARLFKKPVLLYAIGVDRINRRISKAVIKGILRSPSVSITVRDAASKMKLIHAGLVESSIAIGADPVFGIGPLAEMDPTFDVLLVPRLPLNRESEAVWKAVLAVIRERGWLARALLFQPQFEQQESAVFKEAGVVTDQWNGNLGPDVLTPFRTCRAVVSARFHGAVLAALAGKPFIGLGDPDKVGRFCADWGAGFLSNADTLSAIDRTIGTLIETAANPQARDLERLTDLARNTLDLEGEKLHQSASIRP